MAGSRAARRKKADATSPAQQAAAVRRVFEQVHAHWADEPLVSLGGATPRAAVETPDGRAAVIRVLEQLDRDERNRARREERPMVGVEFLWDQLGLSKHRPDSPPPRKRSS